MYSRIWKPADMHAMFDVANVKQLQVAFCFRILYVHTLRLLALGKCFPGVIQGYK